MKCSNLKEIQREVEVGLLKDIERSKAPDWELGFHVLEEIGKCFFMHNDIYYSNWQKKGQSCVSILQHDP